MELTLLFVALVVLAWGLISGKADSWPVTGPMVFTAVGIVAARIVGIGGAADAMDVELLAELTLVLVLFTDASHVSLRRLTGDEGPPARLLLVGLPLAIALGAAAGRVFFPSMGLFAIAVLAAVLAPTDAALGKAVIEDHRVPERMRRTLNVESGLNDGLALPLLLILVACAQGHAEHGALYWVGFTLLQVLGGAALGAACGVGSGWLLKRSADAQSISPTYQRIAVLAVSLAAFASAELVGANGLISAFVAGISVGIMAPSVCRQLQVFGETLGEFLTLMVFLVYGAMFVLPAISHAGTADWIYAALSLVLIRPVAVVVSLVGSSLDLKARLFAGWFGPRGLATILYGLLVLERSGIPEAEGIFRVAVLTVLLSVVAHGITAAPLAAAYGGSGGAGSGQPAGSSPSSSM